MKGSFVPDLWSKKLAQKFHASLVFGTSANQTYMYGKTIEDEYREIMDTTPRTDAVIQAAREWHCHNSTWKKVFAWKPVHTESGRKWLRHVMRSQYTSFGDPATVWTLYFTIPAYVRYRLDDKILRPA